MPLRRKGLDRSNSNSPENRSNSYIQEDTDEEDVRSGSQIVKPEGWGCRHVLAFWGFWGFVASYAMRVNLSFAIVAMVYANTSTSISVNGSSEQVCKNLIPKAEKGGGGFEVDPDVGEFDWSGYEQGIILGSFFWGYVITQVPGGLLAKRIGGKWPFGIGMLVTAIFSLLTPWAARTGVGSLIVVRVIQGLGEGVTFPSMHALLAKWTPPLERSKIGAFVYAGTQIGTVIALPACGYLISSNFLGGWPAVFYVFGIFGIVWFVFWSIFVFDNPASHPRIEAKELSYIQHSIGPQSSSVRTPWKKMLTSMPVLAILVAQTGHGWGLYTLLTEMPTYMKTVLHFDIKKNSWLSAFPYFVMWLVSLMCSWVADYLRERNIATTTTVRIVFNTIAHWGPAIALVGAAYSGCERFLTVALLTLAVGINGAAWVSFQVNHIDIAPNHAGVMMGITNGFANLCGIAAPYVAGSIINGGASLANWKLIFFIAATVYLADNMFYILFASGEEQSWNSDESSPTRKIDRSDRDPLLPSHSGQRTSMIRPTNSGTYNP